MSAADSPFHPGECAIQSRLGVRERVEEVGRRIIRDQMPDQHREFFVEQPLLFLGSLDETAQPWASALFGPPGFARSLDSRRLEVRTGATPGDPLLANLRDGAQIGLLGIQFHTRRRNRLNGRIERLGDGVHFRLHVEQSFGNCPKYIQKRDPDPSDVARPGRAPRTRPREASLDAAARSLVARADTFFIASAYLGADAGGGMGVDVSHRGGKPGFVQAEDERTLLVPDYVGNYLFNTLGNLLVNPRCGLLFLDFETGDTLQLAADAEILWEPSQARFSPGALRMLRFHVRDVLAVAGALPLRWTFLEYSPELDRL